MIILKKKLLMLLLMTVSVLSVWAEGEPGDSTVRVIGWFCTGDTLVYHVSTVKAEVADGDTVVTESSWNRFRICVKDSTQKGYLMEYMPLEVSLADSASARGRIALLSARAMIGTRILFKTDALGAFKEMANWKEVYDDILANSYKVIDQVYLENPTLPSVITKPEMLKGVRERCQEMYGSKEKLANVFQFITMLLAYHGKEFVVGENESEGAGGKVLCEATRGKLPDEETSTDDEYQLYIIVSMPEANGTTSTIHYSYEYFADGWPRGFLVTVEEEMEGKQVITQIDAEWEEKSWK